MHRVVLLLAALAGLCYGEQMCCSMEDKRAILEGWKSLWRSDYTDRRVTIGQEAFRRLFKVAPETKDLFTRVNVQDINSPEFRAHVIRVTNGLDAAINLSFSPEALAEELDHLAEQHAGYEGLTKEHFKLFRSGLIDVLREAVPCFSGATFNRCITVMQDRIAANL